MDLMNIKNQIIISVEKTKDEEKLLALWYFILRFLR